MKTCVFLQNKVVYVIIMRKHQAVLYFFMLSLPFHLLKPEP